MERYKAFLDTNVVLDMLLGREGANFAKLILKSLDKNDCVISVASFYTCAFYVEKYLKKNNIFGDKKVAMMRSIMNDLLDVLTVTGIDESGLRQGINDMAFKDLEDSMQLQTAIAAGCNIVITANIQDFKDSKQLPVVTSENFVENYIHNTNQ